jgi:hypothetical protein
MALTTLADIKVFLGIEPSDTSQDALITMFKDSIEETIINYCDTDFTIQTVVNERVDGLRSDVITPDNYPITDVDAVYFDVEVDGTGGWLLDASREYDWDDGAIYLRGNQTPFARRGVRIDYKWGYASVPANVKMCVYISTKAMMQRHNKNTEDVGSISKQDESQQVGGMGVNGIWDTETGLPNAAVALIKDYRTFEFPASGMAQRNT